MLKLWRRDVVSLNPDRGPIVGRVVSPTRQPVRFLHQILNLFRIILSSGGIVASHLSSQPRKKNCHYYYSYTADGICDEHSERFVVEIASNLLLLQSVYFLDQRSTNQFMGSHIWKSDVREIMYIYRHIFLATWWARINPKK